MPGNIWKRQGKRGVRYVARIDVGRDAQGRRVQESKTFTRRKDADAWLVKLRDSLLNHSYVQPSTDTVSQLVDRYLESRRDLGPGSLNTYHGFHRAHIGPWIGRLTLAQLTPNHIQDMYNALSGTLPRQVHQVLNPALRWAVRRRQIPRNPCDDVIVPKPSRDRTDEAALDIWSPEELHALLDELRMSEPWYYPLAATMAATGMRPGEAFALHWSDLDLTTGRIQVRRTAAIGLGSMRYIADDPKTPAGRRVIPIDQDTTAILRAHWRDLEEVRQVEPAFGDGLVFPGKRGGLMGAGAFIRGIRAAAARVGVPGLRPHAFRHTHASLLLAAGRPVHYVQRRLGHESAMTTMRVYAHVIPSTDQEDADVYQRILASARTQIAHSQPGIPRVYPS